MSYGATLPFPRGQTMWGGDADLISASDYAWLEGRTYKTEDTEHGSGQPVILRVVRNKGSRLPYPTGGVQYGVTANWLGRKVRGEADGETKVAQAPDDKYTTGITTNDLFYVLDAGPVRCLAGSLATGVTAMSAGQGVGFGLNGGLLLPSTGSERMYGTLNESVTTGTTGNRKVLVIAGGLFAHKA